MTETALFLLLMVPGTLFLGLNDVLVRKVLRGGHAPEQSLVAFDYLSVAVVLCVPLLVIGIPELKPGFWPAILTTVTLNIFAAWVWFSAFRREEASLISPLRLISPPLVVLTGYLVLREQPTFGGFLGILVTIVGLWILISSEASFSGVRISHMIRRPGVMLGILGAISFAISFPFDKQAVVSSSALFSVILSFAGVGLGNLIFSALRNRGIPAGISIRENWRSLTLMPFVHAAGSFLTFAALPYALAAYSSSVKRLWSFWAVLLSGKFLKEKNIKRKLLATIVMLAGIVVTLLFG